MTVLNTLSSAEDEARFAGLFDWLIDGWFQLQRGVWNDIRTRRGIDCY
jgi:hypothetical protein